MTDKKTGKAPDTKPAETKPADVKAADVKKDAKDVPKEQPKPA